MSLWSRRQAGFIIMEDGGTDGSGTNAGDKIIYDGDGAGVASDAEHFMTYQHSVSDEEKPKFAGLRREVKDPESGEILQPAQKLDKITLEEALELFKLRRLLGETSDNEEVAASIGRFGPYIRYVSKFVSLKREDDPYTVTLERALELVAEKKKADAEKQIKLFEDEGISILNGRYGPYVTNGKKNAKVPK